MTAEVASRREVEATVNGDSVVRTVPTHRTLVDFLREDLDLTGTTAGCRVGVCGCCTVLVDGEPVNGCLELAVNVDGRSVTTVEGLGRAGDLGRVQRAFLDEEGFQCGYCTPGMVVMATRLLEEHPAPDDDTIDRYMAENLCRCTGYESIRHAIHAAADSTDPD